MTQPTVSVTAGSTSVVGTGTAFLALKGDLLTVAGVTAAVLTASATLITLVDPWPGPTLVNRADFSLSATGRGWNSGAQTYQRVNDLLDKIAAGLPLVPGANGPLASRSTYDIQPKGFVYLATSPLPWGLYIKQSDAVGDWSPGETVRQAAESTIEAEQARDAAQAAAGAASGSASSAAGKSGLTAADRLQTGDDRRQTGEDRAATGILLTTAQGAANSAGSSAGVAAGNAALTASDRAATAADRITTGADRVAADASATAAGLMAANAAATVASSAASGTDDTGNALVLADLVGYVVALVTSDGAFRSKLMDFASGSGTFSLIDAAGNLGLLLDQQGLQAPAITAPSVSADSGSFQSLTAGSLAVQSFAAALLGLSDGSGFSVNPNGTGYEIADANGFVIARFDGSGLTIGNITVNGAINTPNGFSISSGLEFGAGILTAYDDPNIAFVVTDPAGWIIAALTKAGKLQVQSIQATTSAGVGDYSQDEIAERNARNLGMAAAVSRRVDSSAAAPVWNYTHFITGGQSLGQGIEGWPAVGTTAPSGVLMLGQGVRPAGNPSVTNPVPIGDSLLRAAASCAQDGNTGAVLTPAQQAALTAGDPAAGEEAGLTAIGFARRLFLQRAGIQSDGNRQFVTTNVAVSGRTVEQWQKGASPEIFNRLRVTASSVKAAVASLGAGLTYGIGGLLDLQGEFNYDPQYGGSTDKATYKALKLQYYNDFVADVTVGVAGQADKPAMITYQTGAGYTRDAADQSIGQAQWELSLENPSWYLAAPAYPVIDKGGHLDPNGYRWLGCQMGKVLFETVIARRGWKPLSPLQATVRGQTVLIDFHVPQPPLQFQACWVGTNAQTYSDRGFNVVDSQGSIQVSAATIVSDTGVQLSLARAPVGAVSVYYARQTDGGNGNLCDSDPTVAPYNYVYTAGTGQYDAANIPSLIGKPYPLWNWCIAFKITATAN